MAPRLSTALQRHVWLLELEQEPGKWIPTPVTRQTMKKPKPQAFDQSGRKTRWIDKGLALDW